MGRSDTGYQKDNIDFGTSIELSMVDLEGIRHLIKFFGRFWQHMREILSAPIIPVAKRGLRHKCPL